MESSNQKYEGSMDQSTRSSETYASETNPKEISFFSYLQGNKCQSVIHGRQKLIQQEPKSNKVQYQQKDQVLADRSQKISQQQQNNKVQSHQKGQAITDLSYKVSEKITKILLEVNDTQSQSVKDSFNWADKLSSIEKELLKNNKSQFNKSIHNSSKTANLMDPYQQRKIKYHTFFKDQPQINLQDLQIELNKEKQNYQIIKLPFHTPQIEVILRNHSQKFDEAQYQILLSYFKTKVRLKNLSNKAYMIQNIVGTGTFGCIFKIRNQEKNIVAKRLYFKKQTQRDQMISECLEEYSLYKLASFLEIGPKIQFIDGFDVVCYDDCIQFYMELCESPYQQNKQKEKHLKRNLRILHKMKIVHRDIKPQNILYSKHFKKFVFTDFGLSHPIKQQTNIPTLCGICGTLKYLPNTIAQEYQNNTNKSYYIDLYYLDAYALYKSFQIFNNEMLILVLLIKESAKEKAKKKAKQEAKVKTQIFEYDNQKIDYAKYPEYQKIHFQIRITGFNKQISTKFNKIINQIQDQRLKQNLRIKLQKYVQQFNKKKIDKFVWSKKCSKIQQHYVNKGYLKIAQKLLLQRQQIINRKNKRDINQLKDIYQNLARFYINYDLDKAKMYLIQIQKLLTWVKQKNIKDECIKIQFIYDDLVLLLKLYEQQGTEEQIYQFLMKYINKPSIWRSLYRYVKPFVINRKLQKAKQIFKIAIKIMETNQYDQQYTVQTGLRAEVYWNLAKVYSTNDQYLQSNLQANKALNILKQKSKQDYKYYPISGLIQNLIGFNYLQMYKISDSFYHFRIAQQLNYKNYGENLYLSQTRNNIAYLYQIQGKFAQAFQYRIEALQIRKKAVGPMHQSTAIVYYGLASTQFQKGELRKIIQYLNQQMYILQNLKSNVNKQIIQCKCFKLTIYIELAEQEKIKQLMEQIIEYQKTMKNQRLSVQCDQSYRKYHLYKNNFLKYEQSLQFSFSAAPKDNPLIFVKLYEDYIQLKLAKNQITDVNDYLKKIEKILSYLNLQQSYRNARYHYLSGRMHYATDNLIQCIMQINKAVDLFKSYFEYHHDLFDCYLTMLQIKIIQANQKKTKQLEKQIYQLQKNIENVIKYHGFHQSHRMVIRYQLLTETTL